MAQALELGTFTGPTITYTAGADIAKGDVVVSGNIVGVAPAAIANGASGQLRLGGLWRVAKVSGAISQGDDLFWDDSNNGVGTTATLGKRFGVAATAALSGDSTVDAFLDPFGSAAEPASASVYGLVKKAAVVAALTDNGGGASADGTIGAVTAPTALTHSVGTADNTVEDVSGSFDQTILNNNFKELTTAQAANRLAIIALTDAVKELSTKVNEIVAGQKTAAQMATS